MPTLRLGYLPIVSAGMLRIIASLPLLVCNVHYQNTYICIHVYYVSMNALECRTLAATCMHDSYACIAWLTVYADQEYSTTYIIPSPLHACMTHGSLCMQTRSIELHTLHLNMSWLWLTARLSLQSLRK